MKLYAIISTSKGSGRDTLRLDLAPMNHAAACNFMDACRNQWTDYRLTEWPADHPTTTPPMLADGYRRDKDKLSQTV